MSKKRCLTKREKKLYLEYILGINLENINPDELFKVEEHLFECEECFMAVQKDYELLNSIINWNVQKDNEVLNIVHFMETMREKSDIMENDSLVKEQLISHFLSKNTDYNTEGMREFLSEKQNNYDKLDFQAICEIAIVHDGGTEKVELIRRFIDNGFPEKIICSNRSLSFLFSGIENPENLKDAHYFLVSKDVKDGFLLKKMTVEVSKNKGGISYDDIDPGNYYLFTDIMKEEIHLKNPHRKDQSPPSKRKL